MDQFEQANESDDDKKVDTLKKINLLQKLNSTEIEELAKVVEEKTYNAEACIIKQNDEGDGFYMIKKGQAEVIRVNESGAESVIGQLAAGDYFGETALLNNTKRGATIKVTSATMVCWFVSTKSFTEMFQPSKLNVQFAKRKAVSAEKMNSNSTYAPVQVNPEDKEKTDKQVQEILHAIRYNVLFMNLSHHHQISVIKEMYKKNIKKGEDAIVQGSQGDNLYVVESGEFHVFVNETRVAIRQQCTCFGELALMYNSPRAATVRASVDSVVWVVDRFTFRRVVTNVSAHTLEQYKDFLKGVQLLAPLAEYEREKIAEALEEVSAKKGEKIIEQKQDGDAMYVVLEGSLSVKKDDKDLSVKYGTGDYFGERALLKNEPRAATVTVDSESCKLLRLDRNAFSLLLGPLEDIMKSQVNKYDSPDSGEASKAAPQATGVAAIAFQDLEVLGTLGKGSFGHVQLVWDKTNKKTYALKAVSKAQIVQTGQQGHIMSEKRAMAALNHPFLIRLYQTYKDQDRLYFLLEPSLGGELFSVLREKTLFDEDTSRFYSSHVVLAFEYMHSLNYVYRDLKPENLLLDKKGYIKVTDFGFAKDISGGRTWTLCGTPDYLAPEIVAGKGHGKGVDWWTLGVFIYEMLASYPPFYDEDPMKTYAKIMHGTITFPSHFSKEAISIVKKLLYHKATKRLGVVKGGASMIKKHAWFKGFDWDQLLAGTLVAPFVPSIKDSTDISNFDDYGDEEDEIAPYTDDGSNWDKDF